MCEIARAVAKANGDASKEGFRRELQRIDRGLARCGKSLKTMWRYYMDKAAPLLAGEYDVIAVDMSEIVKRHGKKMDFLCMVRDGSESTESNKVLHPGWWTVEMTATTLKHHVLPLLRRLWSSKHPDFKSSNHEVIQAIRQVLPYVTKKVMFVFDRGFDGAETLWPALSKLGIDWVVRLKTNRKVRLGNTKKWLDVDVLAESIAKPHRTSA